MEVTMKPDRPIIISTLFLAGGLTLIFGYANGTAGLSAAFPIANSILHVNVNAAGPAALGGIALLGIGVVLLVWALLVALVSQVMQLGGSDRESERRAHYRSREIDEEDDSTAGSSVAPAPRASFLGLESAGPLPRSVDLEQRDSRSS
jgi:Na+-transporting methylmalonyl-CoA/oxaloacetate decarboxylase gamma subunit